MSIFLPNFALSHQDSYKSGRTPFRPPFPGTRISKNIHTYLSLGSNGLSIELLHTFLAWNSYPHMKISWFQLIMADFDDRWWKKIAIFFHLFQSQAMRCKIRTRWAMRIIFYSSDTPRVIFLPRDHLKKGGRKGVRSLSFEWFKQVVTICFFHQFFMLESHSKLGERTPFRPPFFKWSHGKYMTHGVSLD